MIPPAFGAIEAARSRAIAVAHVDDQRATIAEMHHKTCNKDDTRNDNSTKAATNAALRSRSEANRTWRKGLE
jgi:hypothetical protein